MGYHSKISHSDFPKQGTWLHRRVKVCFHYDTNHEVGGTIVREDLESPGVGIIACDDGRYVLMTECQYSLDATPAEGKAG